MNKKLSVIEETRIGMDKIDRDKRDKELKKGLEAMNKKWDEREKLQERAKHLANITLDEMTCRDLIIYSKAIEHTERLTEYQKAMVLYATHKNKKHEDYGFKTATELWEALGFKRSAGYEWIKYVENYGENFPILIEKVGLNLGFFRNMKALPESVQKAVIEGEKIAINDKEHDLSKMGKDAESREVIRSLVHEVNKSLGKYDTTTRTVKENKALREENEVLIRERDKARNPLPKEIKEAIETINSFKEKGKFVFNFFYYINISTYDSSVRLELLNAAYYLGDMFSLLANTISNRYDERPYPADLLETEIKGFAKKYEGDDDLGIDISKEDKEMAKEQIRAEL